MLDPDTGNLLASVSYPWPSVDDDESEQGDEVVLDRARYGLYPPGSTFKLVTAAAALARDPALASTTFSCARLPDGRVGARLSGWSRPVRDDVLDANPHGTIDMHGALVHSCNAYFAQLAVKLGPQALIDCAARAGIALTPSTAPLARVRDTLPQVGYGQADVRHHAAAHGACRGRHCRERYDARRALESEHRGRGARVRAARRRACARRIHA